MVEESFGMAKSWIQSIALEEENETEEQELEGEEEEVEEEKGQEEREEEKRKEKEERKRRKWRKMAWWRRRRRRRRSSSSSSQWVSLLHLFLCPVSIGSKPPTAVVDRLPLDKSREAELGHRHQGCVWCLDG